MDEKKQAIIEKVQKMLILSQDQEGTPEGETAKKMAALLMAKFRIDETEVDLETDHLIRDYVMVNKDSGHFPQWPGVIINGLSRAFDTRCIYTEYHDRREYAVIGTFSDVQTVCYLSDVVLEHIEREARSAWPADRNWRKRNQIGNVAMRIILGRINELKNEMDKTFHEDVTCRDLMVCKVKKVEEAMAEEYPNARTARSKSLEMPTDQKSRSVGERAGRTAPLSLGIEEGVAA